MEQREFFHEYGEAGRQVICVGACSSSKGASSHLPCLVLVVAQLGPAWRCSILLSVMRQLLQPSCRAQDYCVVSGSPPKQPRQLSDSVPRALPPAGGGLSSVCWTSRCLGWCRYSIKEVIGKGSYGVVCSAIDNFTGEKVAIKKINNVFEHVSDATRILREIKLLRLLKHPGQQLRPAWHAAVFLQDSLCSCCAWVKLPCSPALSDVKVAAHTNCGSSAQHF